MREASRRAWFDHRQISAHVIHSVAGMMGGYGAPAGTCSVSNLAAVQ